MYNKKKWNKNNLNLHTTEGDAISSNDASSNVNFVLGLVSIGAGLSAITLLKLGSIALGDVLVIISAILFFKACISTSHCLCDFSSNLL